MAELANDTAACLLESLGNPKRLEVFQRLVRAGDEGLAVGELQALLGIPASTLSHHLAQLVRQGLVSQRREGRVLRCTVDFARVDALLEFLIGCCARSDCC